MECADYTLRNCWIRKSTFLVSGFGGNGACCGADEEPFGGTADAAPEAAAASEAQGGGEPRLTGFAVDGEVAQRPQVFGGNGGFGWSGGEFADAAADCRTMWGDGTGIWLGSSRTICAGVTILRFSAAMIARVCAS
jgi:hypothetical protein